MLVPKVGYVVTMKPGVLPHLSHTLYHVVTALRPGGHFTAKWGGRQAFQASYVLISVPWASTAVDAQHSPGHFTWSGP